MPPEVTMPRFSIAKLMLVVAFVAANLALVHILLDFRSGEISETRGLLVGLLPLSDSLIIALWALASRWRISLRRRPRAEGRRFVGWYVAACGPILLCLLAAILVSPLSFETYLDTTSKPAQLWLDSSGLEKSYPDLILHVVLPAFLFTVISGPPLLVALVASFVMGRFQLVLTPRSEEPCDGSRSSR
jgi:hypothetical protein